MSSSPLIHITSGDIDGIGLEVTLKALELLKSKIESHNIHARFCIWTHASQIDLIKKFIHLNSIQALAQSKIISSLDDLETNPKEDFKVFFITSTQSPAMWFSHCIDECLDKKADAIVTAPLSKQETYSLGYKDLGHTDMLRRKSNISKLHMAFVGKYFNVCLYTDHIPLKDIKIEETSLNEFSHLCLDFNHKVSPKSQLRLLGLNPHAGDQGLIGDKDEEIKTWLKEWGLSIDILPADSAFVDYMKKDHKTYLSFYHDQGLIPFKMAHGFTGFQTTLGLPFVRTSVDHGTAKNIYKKNQAQPKSMYEAILGACTILKGQSNDQS